MITGVKHSPERLIIPKALPYGSDEEDLEVIEIKSDAFQNCESIRSVYFLTDDYKRFDTTIMFSNCSSLKCVKLRAGVNAIGSYAFSGTALTNCVLEENFARIGQYAFKNCIALEELYIPDTVTTISVDTLYCGGS